MRSYPLDVFLPAAGFGERLRPATNHLPKPLLPILGTPIIEGILGKLAAVCDGTIGINLHWKADLLRAWAAASPWHERIVFFPEDPILGTGGALKNAESLLSRRAFIVHNSDILLDIDFARLVEEHLASGNVATLACHRLPHLSNVVIDDRGQVLDVENPGASKPDPTHVADKVAYTGIAVYSPEILSFLPSGVSHATVAWVAASKAGRRVRAFDVTGAYWNDVGDPATYARGVLDALRERGETVYRSATARCGRLEIDGYVVLESRPEDLDFERHLAYTEFFARHAVPVPAMFSSDSAGKRALFEDLGDASLYAYLKLPRDTASIESVYRAVMQSLVTIHTSATDRVHECPLLKTRIFDYDYFRWETTYFLDRFVVGLRKLQIASRPAVDAALHRLAQRVDAAAKSIIHRDFQCQNIMIHGGVPRIIDYQGARMAPPAYDVASILWDPYYRLADGVRERLLGYYLAELKAHRP